MTFAAKRPYHVDTRFQDLLMLFFPWQPLGCRFYLRLTRSAGFRVPHSSLKDRALWLKLAKMNQSYIESESVPQDDDVSLCWSIFMSKCVFHKQKISVIFNVVNVFIQMSCNFKKSYSLLKEAWPWRNVPVNVLYCGWQFWRYISAKIRLSLSMLCSHSMFAVRDSTLQFRNVTSNLHGTLEFWNLTIRHAFLCDIPITHF